MCNFVTYLGLCQLVLATILCVKLSEMFVTLLSLKYALSVDKHVDIFWN